ncbi:hypothetical protein BaRGS_00000836 [Batillaria attramentaria]|uniref:JmjC domain-containing protein n=1 Tax=Batillaria attramentaria TaxID=370345 RepID=A0ABD0M904_9CAEN
MEEEEVELISEWPVTTSHSGHEHQQCHGGSQQEHFPCASPMVPPQTAAKSADERPSTDWMLHHSSEGNTGSGKHSNSKGSVLDMVTNKRHIQTDKHCKEVPTKIMHLLDSDRGTYFVPTSAKERDRSLSRGDAQISQDSKSNHGSQEKCLLNISNSHSSAAEDKPQELLAQARLARWWRREGQRAVRLELKDKVLPVSANPNTLLFHVARLPEGRKFLEEELQHLKQRVKQGREVTGDLMAALGSVEEWLGKVEDAVAHLEKATSLHPDNKEWRWLLHKVCRQLAVRRRQTQLMNAVPPNPTFPVSQQVEKVSAQNLTFLEFFHKYALARVPVIITDLVSTMTQVPWNLQHISNAAGECMAQVKRSVPGSVEWAGLEESRTVKVSEFLHHLHSRRDYLFDWSLPLHCPRLAEELTIPRDFLQRTSPGSLYRDSWPSLFVAPPGVHSGLHVDAFASNFWMALFQGRKRWVFFRQEDVPCLYPVHANSLDPVFEAKVTDVDLEAHPLLSLVQPMECVLTAGEILFVPGGCPHYVENLDTTVAISANFVDLSNWRNVLQELDVNGLIDPRAADLAHQFRQPMFISRMNSDIGDLPWHVFKAWRPSDVNSFDTVEESVVS